jgi:putative oxidoreductase
MKLGSLIARVVVGGLFVGHGTQKLFGWFGGHGPEGTGQFFESAGIRPGRRQAIAAGASEAGGGVLLAAGLLTPLAAASISGVMITAIRTVHAEKGVWVMEGGFEYNATLLALLFLLTEVGPGPWSLDAALGIEAKGSVWALVQLAAGAAGSTAAMARAKAEELAEQATRTREPAGAAA